MFAAEDLDDPINFQQWQIWWKIRLLLYLRLQGKWYANN